MKRLVLGSIAFIALAFAGPAGAADLAVPVYKAPVALPTPAYSWTGFYIGGNGGGEWSCSHRSQNDPNTLGDPINGLPGGFNGVVGGIVQLPSGHCLTRALGGLQLGYNRQFEQLVLGVEIDFDAMNVKDTENSFTNVPGAAGIPGGFFNIGPVHTICTAAACQGTRTEQVSLKWLSTVRARAGIPILDNRLLLFATGGLAFGDVSTNGSVSVLPPPIFPVSTWSGSSSTTKTGYTVGGGVEYAVLNNWTIKGEYLYYDLGTVSHTLNLTSCSSAVLACFATLGTTSDKINGGMVRGGLNYKF